MKIPKLVKIFKNRSAELDEKFKKSLFAEKLDNPALSCGTRKKISITKQILIINPIDFNIYVIYFRNFNISNYFL